MQSFISADNHIILFLIITGAAAFGLYSEHKKWFGKVSGILITMISMSVLSMTGVIPVASDPKVPVETYDLVFSYFVPIAIPLLLFSSNLIKIIRESGKLLIAYILGAIGVVLGCFIAYAVIDLGEHAGDTAGVIGATLIGGSMNFIATGEILNFSTHPLFAATIAIDNFVANLYILLLFLIPSIAFLKRFFVKPKEENTLNNDSVSLEESQGITVEKIAISVFIAFLIVGLGTITADFLKSVINTSLNLSILIITIYSLLVANLFPRRLKSLESTAFSLGLWLMYIFLAVIGAATNLEAILGVGTSVLLFYLIIMFFHLFLMITVAKLFKLDVYEVIISSAANIMGPSVAAPMAASLGQKNLVTPGILVGILGYIIGTFVGVSIALVLS